MASLGHLYVCMSVDNQIVKYMYEFSVSLSASSQKELDKSVATYICS